ncbi:MAG: hypothetical protein IH991_15165 [Planctomycetes bacterium]|nr:hypothetical protein [Planctomycetota bacterium]
MPPKRTKIISAIHGKLTRDGKISEPDIYWILEKWLDRHPEIKARQDDIRVVRGQWTTEDGLRTEVITVSIVAGDDIADYDPAQDADLYEYFLAEAQYFSEA